MADARADVIVVGAGVIGLACARALASRARVLVIERHARPGSEGSARNSGVIHAGVHHPLSLRKGELCVRGRALLLEHCARAGVPHRLTGKLIVASGEGDREALAEIASRARENGVEHRVLGRDEVRALEPRVACDEALLVPGTGVVATRALVRSLEADAIARGTSIAYGHEVRALARADEWIVECAGLRARAGSIVIAAGLASDLLASLAGIDPVALGGPHRFCAGRWMSLARRLDRAVSRLVYPVPSPGGLGIHLTIDLDGSLRAGPDTCWIDDPTAPIPPPDAHAFAAAIARYLPGISASDLVPGDRGIRAKLHGEGEPAADFVIRDATELGAPGAIVLLGLESPGLTACLAIGEAVAAACRH